MLDPPPVAVIPPYITAEDPSTANPNPPVRASTRGDARRNENIRTPRPREFHAVATTSAASDDVGGTTLQISDIRSVNDWESIPNDSDDMEYLVLYQEGNEVIAQWETFPPI